ncbi:MAG: hypothetical protein WCD38_10005 [Candidatus Tumulicola sp.]
MRYLTSALAIVAIAFAFAACTGKSSSSSDQSNSTSAEATAAASGEATAAPSSDAGAMSSEASAEPAAAAASGPIPDYPGATVRSQSDASNMMTTNAMGRVLETPDSFDKVYQWYQQKMPPDSERMHVTQPHPDAVFVITDPAKGQDSVAIVVSHGKTMITIAHVGLKTK